MVQQRYGKTSSSRDRPKAITLLMMMAIGAFAAPLGADDNASPPELRLDQVQVIGSHNSYRSGISAEMLDYLSKTRRDAKRAFNYAHPSLPEQLDLGIRQLELDLFADPKGGWFAEPFGETIAPTAINHEEMSKPGYKVLHIPGLDYQSSCPTLVTCLEQIKLWSNRNPGHLPIFVTVDAKDTAFAYPNATLPYVLSTRLLDALDAEIRSVLPDDMLITPDLVRGDYPTLRDAVRAKNWPTLSQARGKVMFILDVREETAETYRRDHPSLEGRVMFAPYPEDDAEASVFIVQNPRGPEERNIQRLVKLGFIVRTRSDSDTREARNYDYSGFRSAERSGAQMISTDFYPGAPDPQRLYFKLSFKGGALQQCNPVTAGQDCRMNDK